MMWTPYQIEVILHHHCSTSEFTRSEAPLYHPTVNDLLTHGILTTKNGYLVTTERGKALVEMWCKTPWPVKIYVDPREMENQIDRSKSPETISWVSGVYPRKHP